MKRTLSIPPLVLEGDLWASIASVRVGERRLVELAGKYGVATFENAKASYRALADLPKGSFELSEEQDDGQRFNVKVTIADDRFTVDLRNNPDQAESPINTSRDGAMVAVQMMFKSLTDPRSPANGGSFAPIELLTSKGAIFQEGLRLPSVRLFEAGEPIESVFDIISANSRQPDVAHGDLWAQIAASRKAAQRIKRLVLTYGHEAYRDALSTLYEEGEMRALLGLSDLPKGIFEIEEPQDDNALWRVRIEITDDCFTVDLTGNPKQTRTPHNTSRDGAVIAAQMIFKALSDPSLVANAGAFQPLRVITEPGTVFHAEGDAPHGYYFETRIRLYDMLWRCLAQAMPERLPAGHFASICGTVIAGVIRSV